MTGVKEIWATRILNELHELATKEGDTSDNFSNIMSVGRPPESTMGDISFPLFPYAKYLKLSPALIASTIADKLIAEGIRANAAGGYLNIHVDRVVAITELFDSIFTLKESWGNGNELCGQKVMIEYSSPNTNKPLHLGHLRNDILGESCARIFSARGAKVLRVNLVNDRGVHICKSMLAYQEFGNGETPENLRVKSDRFVGDFYVKFVKWARTDKSVEEKAQKMLRDWESGDKEVRKLWNTMNKWALSGIEATYRRTGISFDRIYRESETYLQGRAQVLEGLKKGIFHKDKDGSICFDMGEIGLDTKVLLRSDGTTVYITQDFGTAVSRYEDWPFDQLIYVVGSEQEYHFKALFHVLDKLGYSWASKLRHLSYGMVNLPEGKMKSREGTVVDADELIDKLSILALAEIRLKGREGLVEDAPDIAEKIALAALHYFLLQVSPTKDMIFNPDESLSFNGNSGPYLQYTAARINSLIAKASSDVLDMDADPKLLNRNDEWELCRKLGDFPDLVSRSAKILDPSILAVNLREIARDFSHYYHEVPIAKARNKALAAARLSLARAVLTVLKNGFKLLNIPFIESM